MPHPGHVVAAVDGTAADHPVPDPQRRVLQHDEVDILPAERSDERVVQPRVVEQRAARLDGHAEVDVAVRGRGARCHRAEHVGETHPLVGSEDRTDGGGQCVDVEGHAQSVPAPTVLHVLGVQTEADVAFAALSDLLAPVRSSGRRRPDSRPGPGSKRVRRGHPTGPLASSRCPTMTGRDY